jgi:glycosyltransferase involved in cell wall biosynthesis
MDKCLEAVVAQTYTDPFEIIIAQHPGYDYSVKVSEIPENVCLKHLSCGSSLSSKRNAVMQHAKGKYIVNIDDDVVPEPDWLRNMVDAVLENDYDVFWGLVKPIYEKDFPEDLEPFEMLIGGFHFDRKGNLRRKGLIGCNFGFRRGLGHSRGKFCEELGRGRPLNGGEEVLFVAESINPRIGLIKEAVVGHYIQKERVNFFYILGNQFMNVQTKVAIYRFQDKGSFIILKEIMREIPSLKQLDIYFFRYFVLFLVKLTGFALATLKTEKIRQSQI